jgi:hypothetical protein
MLELTPEPDSTIGENKTKKLILVLVFEFTILLKLKTNIVGMPEKLLQRKKMEKMIKKF